MSKIRITQLAEITGFTPATIRFYEHSGLLPAASRTPSGHRVYGADDVERLRFIARGKQLGLALDEIRELVHGGGDADADAEQVLDTLRTRIAEVHERIAELSAFSAQLVASMWAVRSRHVPAAAAVEPACREHWARALSHPHTRRQADDLVTLTFPSTPALVGVLADLVAHESGCRRPAHLLLRCTSGTAVLEVALAEVTRRLLGELVASTRSTADD
ncbi:MerR family transcriptional regulator [Saccharothrix sp. HUAS TT1]|uniref:MerR family transcriptional regulator n=1 Tax=unclassified Saccharothrix TaxID=2593673 RepID=UPI00345BF454